MKIINNKGYNVGFDITMGDRVWVIAGGELKECEITDIEFRLKDRKDRGIEVDNVSLLAEAIDDRGAEKHFRATVYAEEDLECSSDKGYFRLLNSMMNTNGYSISLLSVAFRTKESAVRYFMREHRLNKVVNK